MPDISDILDVAIEDLSPEQLQQLKDATDQFQQKCLMSFKKNRSGVLYLKNEMPRVLLSGETDATTLQEKEECMQAFRDAAEDVMGKHHRAFLGVFKQMMVSVFGLGIEQVFSRASIQSSTPSGIQHGDWRVQFSATIAKPASPASSAERWEPDHPASSTRRWRSTSSTSSAGRKRAASPATSVGRYRSTDSTAEPISAHIWGDGVRFVWSSAHVHLQDFPNQQQIAE
jgi:hypothetical protein